MTMLERIKRIARKKGIEFENIIESPLTDKKYRIIFKDKRPIDGRRPDFVDFGSKGMSDYLIHKDKERRRRFHQRFENNKGYNDPSSGLYYSQNLLWPL